jgi:hypothetical protein
MIKTNNFRELGAGFATITYKTSDSPLRMGELATFKPFAGLFGESFKGIGTPVSDEKFDSIAWRKRYVLRTQTFVQASSTLIKNVTPVMFDQELDARIATFITGKKAEYNKQAGKPMIHRALFTNAEIAIIKVAEFALDKFHTLNGIEIKVSFYDGGEATWQN